jgi:pimeloyl-ACP methyl ester carboxylesterase
VAGVPGEAKSEFLSGDGVHLHYLDRGNGGEPPVVCVHGYTSSAQAFSAPARIFRDRFHFVVPDVRGHGESGWSPPGADAYADRVRDLAAIVDRLGLAQTATSCRRRRRSGW